MLTINISEVIWTVINFFLLYFLLNHFLYKPVVKFMDERNARLKKGFDAEKAAQEAAEEHEKALSAKLDDAGAQARRLIADGKSSNETVRAEALKEARADAAAERQSLREKAVSADSESRAAIRANEAQLASALSARLLGR